jgi:hypothetical protein
LTGVAILFFSATTDAASLKNLSGTYIHARYKVSI